VKQSLTALTPAVMIADKARELFHIRVRLARVKLADLQEQAQ
jgi:hypothetical protein